MKNIGKFRSNKANEVAAFKRLLSSFYNESYHFGTVHDLIPTTKLSDSTAHFPSVKNFVACADQEASGASLRLLKAQTGTHNWTQRWSSLSRLPGPTLVLLWWKSMSILWATLRI